MPTAKKGRRSASRECVFVAAIGKKGSAIRHDSDTVLSRIVRPALRPTNYRVYRLDELGRPGRITDAILEKLGTADLVVADVTHMNPNVMYELGIRHAWNLPVVVIAEETTKLPFDIRDINVVPYGGLRSKKACSEAQADIRKHMRQFEKGLGKVSAFEQRFGALAGSVCDFRLTKAIADRGGAVLENLFRSLQDSSWEIKKDFEPRRKDALVAIANLVGRHVTRFQNRWITLEEMAEDLNVPELAAILQRIVGRGFRIIDGWNRLDRWLREVRPSRSVLRQANARLKRLIEVARNLKNAVRNLEQARNLMGMLNRTVGGLQ